MTEYEAALHKLKTVCRESDNYKLRDAVIDEVARLTKAISDAIEMLGNEVVLTHPNGDQEPDGTDGDAAHARAILRDAMRPPPKPPKPTLEDPYRITILPLQEGDLENRTLRATIELPIATYPLIDWEEPASEQLKTKPLTQYDQLRSNIGGPIVDAQTNLQKRVKELEAQLSEPGYVDALRNACFEVALLLPKPPDGGDWDQVEALPDWVKWTLDNLRAQVEKEKRSR